MENKDKEPVLVVTDKRGRLVHAGQPESFDKKLLGKYAQDGYKISTITIKRYRAKEWKWFWEK